MRLLSRGFRAPPQSSPQGVRRARGGGRPLLLIARVSFALRARAELRRPQRGLLPAGFRRAGPQLPADPAPPRRFAAEIGSALRADFSSAPPPCFWAGRGRPAHRFRWRRRRRGGRAFDTPAVLQPHVFVAPQKSRRPQVSTQLASPLRTHLPPLRLPMPPPASCRYRVSTRPGKHGGSRSYQRNFPFSNFWSTLSYYVSNLSTKNK